MNRQDEEKISDLELRVNVLWVAFTVLIVYLVLRG